MNFYMNGCQHTGNKNVLYFYFRKANIKGEIELVEAGDKKIAEKAKADETATPE